MDTSNLGCKLVGACRDKARQTLITSGPYRWVRHYLGTITLAQGWAHARAQLVDDRNFIAAIVLGFGTQVELYTYLRLLHTHTAVSAVAASTGASAAAMLACCAHHLADVLPIVGVAGAAVFLNAYKTPLLWVSIVMNLAGVVYLLWKIQQQRQMVCHMPVTV